MAIILSSCLFPEKFEARINVNKDGTYSLTYDGILTWVLAKAAEVQQGKLSAKDEKEIKRLEQEFKKDPNYKKVSYLGHGQFQVLYERKGALSSPVYFINKESDFISILPGFKEKKVTGVFIKGMKVNDDVIVQLKQLGMKIDGRLEVTTNAKVLAHNAKDAPKLMGLLGAYVWEIKSVSDPEPFISLQLE